MDRKRSRVRGLLSLGLESMCLWLLLTSQVRPAGPAESEKAGGEGKTMIVDDFTSKTASGFPGSGWRFVADTVMGGKSQGRVDRTAQAGIPALRMTGDVAAREGNGFVLVSLDLTTGGRPFNASDYSGIRLALKGNRESYAVHLRTTACERPWQFYQAAIETNGSWQVVTIPFKAFAPRGLETPLDPARLTEISLAGIDRSFHADLSVGRVLFYKGEPPQFKPLSAQEEAVIVRRATEAPFSGQYVKSAGQGAYVCKRCGTVLFRSSDKFDSECGWPSFDEARHGTVLRLPDADGQRIEIVCATCGAHLGHLFEGEGFTRKNTRYCVNSISLDFARDDAAQTSAPKVRSEVPKVNSDVPEVTSDVPKAPVRETALFASGCFWGSEYVFHEAPGVLETTVGYTGGRTEHPTYEEVCSGRTGHAEAIQVVFDPGKTSYEALVRIFLETHDFTQVDRQGPDVGTQYRSEIFYVTKEQKEMAEKVIQTVRRAGRKVATKVTPAGAFWPAEQYHQDYYGKNGQKPYCHFYRQVF